MSRIPTLALATLLIPANSFARYSEKDFQRIFKTVLETKTPVPALQLLVFLMGLVRDLSRPGSLTYITVKPI